jgi:diacylglycerol kinase family enzyme
VTARPRLRQSAPRVVGNWRLTRGVKRCVQTQIIDGPATSIRRVHAIINPASGGVGPRAADEMTAVLAEFGLDHHVSELAAGEIESAVRASIDAGPDLIVVLGGDGTTRLVAEMCGPQGPLVAPLSGGTMNKLYGALYGTRPWREAVFGALERGEERWVPGGEVNGRAFYCSAVLGSPALWARAREAVRERRFVRAWRHGMIAFRRAFMARPRYEFDSREVGRGMAIGLICPTVSRALDAEEKALEAAVLDLRDARAGARFILNHLFGDWRDDPDVTVRNCVSGRAWARDSIPGMLDGEFFRFGRQVEMRFRPHAFRALAPAPDPENEPENDQELERAP